jgi:hypothetical protein
MAGRRFAAMNTKTLRPHFHVLIAASLCAAIVIGFARTYYLRSWFELPPLTRAAHIHGVLSTLWILLHYTQARLIAAHQVDWHRTLGVVTAIVGAITFLQAGDFSITAIEEGRAPPGRVPQHFLSVSLGTTFMFGLFLFAGIYMRSRREWHKRFLLLATMVLLLPAIGRFDTMLGNNLGTPRGVLPWVVSAGFVGWAWMHDRRRLGYVHPAMLYGGLLLLAAIPFRIWIGTTAIWQPFAEWVLRIH